MTVFTNMRVNKEWLAMHQCIAENCPVHSHKKTNPVTSVSERLNNEISSEIVDEICMQNCLESNLTKHAQNSTDLNDKEIDIHEDNDTVYQNQTMGALKQIAECYSEDRETCKPAENLEALVQQYKDDVGETSYVCRSDSPCKKVSETFKPKFMCTWLNNNVDINKFPFYKKAVYYGSLRTVRKDFALYSSSVTNHIWTSRKYIGDSDATDNIDGRPLAIGSKASKSHENISDNIGSVLRDIPDVNISDLKLKYAFLFNPEFIFKTTSSSNTEEDKYPYVVQNRNIQAQDEIMLVENDQSSVCLKNPSPMKTNKVVNKNYVDNTKSPGYPPIEETVKSDIADPRLKSDRQTFDHHESTWRYQTHTTSQYNSIDSEKNSPKSAAYCDNRNRSKRSSSRSTRGENENTSPSDRNCSPCTTYTDINVQVPCNTSKVQYNGSFYSPYSPSDSRVTYAIQNVYPPQTPVTSSPYSSYIKTSQTSTYWNVSPLVSSPAFSHYVSPAQVSEQPVVAGQTFRFFTKRNKDPRLQDSHSNKQSDWYSTEKRTEEQRTCNTSRLVSPMCRENYDRKNGRSMHREERRRSVERSARKHRDQSFSYGEDEDPLNGLPHHFKTGRQLSPERYSGSPDSEIFYRINERQNDEEQYADDVMDTFYTEDRPHQNRVGSYRSPLSGRYRSRSPRHTRYKDGRRFRQSSLARFTRDQTMSRERTLPSSHRFRRSKSSPKDDRLLEGSRQPQQSGRHNRHRHNRERPGLSTERKRSSTSNKSRYNTKNNHGKSDYRDISRESTRRENSYRRENECYRKQLSETSVHSSRSAGSSRSSVYKAAGSSSYRDLRKQSVSHKRRDEVSNRLKQRNRR